MSGQNGAFYRCPNEIWHQNFSISSTAPSLILLEILDPAQTINNLYLHQCGMHKLHQSYTLQDSNLHHFMLTEYDMVGLNCIRIRNIYSLYSGNC